MPKNILPVFFNVKKVYPLYTFCMLRRFYSKNIIISLTLVLILGFVASVAKKQFGSSPYTVPMDYFQLWDDVFTLEEEIVANSVFELDGVSKKIKISGLNEKHILRDQNGQRWMVKISSLRLSPVTAEKISRFLRLSGFNSPLLVATTFDINGTTYFCSLQKLVDKDREIRTASEVLELGQRFLDIVLAQELITYMFAIENEFLLTKDNSLYMVDLNNIYFFPKTQKMPSLEEFAKIFAFRQDLFLESVLNVLIKSFYAFRIQTLKTPVCTKWTDLYQGVRMTASQSRDITVRLHTHFIQNGQNTLNPLTAKTLNFIDAMPDDYLEKFLHDDRLKGSLIYKNYLDTVMERKRSLKDVFSSFYRLLPGKGAKKLLAKTYSQKDIDARMETLKLYKTALIRELDVLKAKDLKQPTLELLSFPEAYTIYLASKIHKAVNKITAITNLQKMHEMTGNKFQKDAIKRFIWIMQQDA